MKRFRPTQKPPHRGEEPQEALSDEQRRPELQQKKQTLERHLKFIDSIPGFRQSRAVDANAAVADANARKELADVTAELLEMDGRAQCNTAGRFAEEGWIVPGVESRPANRCGQAALEGLPEYPLRPSEA